ncbi:hypothetical protein EVAR_70802_1 [Eumeta japonica]|uniref:(+)RNA virus helicase C-terminal domain-containing protein n=1 Tax=Eumeta variegata TaxID=151549 RepID=A0A4C1SCA2_EUMVA|nr:hypothetical protein EVAR_70802_1 [Eumeta japonica]
MSIIYMAAYNAANGLVALDKKQMDRTERPKHITPSYDSIVVTARYTRIALEERILEMVKSVTKRKAYNDARQDWKMPDITLVNGVPDCRKTTWVVKHYELGRDVVITTTLEAARDHKEKPPSRLGADANSKVKMMASVLVNGFQGPKSCDRLIVDEALMSYFGSIVIATWIAAAKEVLLIGDVNQLAFIDRLNLFEMQYI